MNTTQTRIALDPNSATTPSDWIALAINYNKTGANARLYFFKLLAIIFTLSSLTIKAATYYIAPNGSDAANGDITHPFATLNKAWTKVVAGDLVYMRGGTYAFNSTQQLTNKNGTAGNLIKIWAYPGEIPVITKGTPFSYGSSAAGIQVGGVSFIHLKGLEITGFTQPNEPSVYPAIRVANTTDCIFELLNNHHNGHGMVMVGNEGTLDRNLVLNCDFHHNADPYSNTPYDNADGLEIAYTTTGVTNTVRGCRSWSNSDDGFDYWNSNGIINTENCWSFWNGYNDNGITLIGIGEGFKFGGPGLDDTPTTLKRTYSNCVAFGNSLNGFASNGSKCKVKLLNCTAYHNAQTGTAYLVGMKIDNTTTSQSIYSNCISYGNQWTNGGLNNRPVYLDPSSIVTTSSFIVDKYINPEFTVTDADFISVSPSGIDGPRQSDGSLPVLPFLHLVAGSDLINTGVDVGLPFNGSAPDLGAFEYASSTNPIANVSISAVPSGTICTGTSITFTASPTNGGTAPTYQWKLNGSNISGAINSIYNSSSLSNGDIISCVMTSSLANVTGNPAISNAFTVAVNSLPVAPLVGTITQATCTISTGSVVLNGLPSTGTWTINPGGITGTGTSKTITGLTAGTYSYTVTNASGCTSSTSANVVINSQPPVPAAPTAVTITQPTCFVATGSIILNSLPSTGTWTINPGGITGTGTSKTITGLTAGTYSYTVTNASGCTSSTSANVVINSQPPVPAAPTAVTITQPTCFVATGSIILNSLPSTGTWTINPGGITGTGTSTTLTGLSSGTYSFAVTNASGCTSSASANVVINAQLAVPVAPTAGTITQPTCSVATGSIVLNGLPSTGTWTINPGGIAGTGTSSTLTGLSSGTYSFTVTNAAGCTSAVSANVVINAQPAVPTAPTAGTITQPNCSAATGSIVLNGLPSTGTWTINPGGITGTGTSTSLTGISSGTYSFTVTNAAGCTSAVSANVVINAQPAVPTAPTAGTITQPNCSAATGSIVLNGLPSTGTWTINPGGITGTGTSTSLTGISSGTYSFTVTNASGCTSSASANVAINAQPAVPAAPTAGTITQPTCSVATGSIVLNGLPLTGTWTINPGGITGTGTSKTITGLTAGTYSYTVTSASGCTSSASANVVINSQPAVPSAPTAGTITQPTCSATTGSIVLNSLPSTGTWTINPGGITGTGTSTTLTGLSSGTYSYTVTNASGCTSSASANLVINSQPAVPSVPTAGTITQPTCSATTGSIVLNSLPSTGTWTINPGGITGTGTSTTLTGLSSGTYSYTVTNASGCTSSASANLVINSQPAVPSAPTAGTITQPTCSATTGSIVLNSLPSTGTWTINPGGITGTGTSTTLSGLSSGTYSFTVTDASGCTSAASANVDINVQPPIPAAPTTGTITQPTCSLATGSIVVNGLPSTGTWTINPGGITGTGTSTTIAGLTAGTYSFTVTNASGCTSSASASVLIYEQPESPIAPTSVQSDRDNFCADDAGIINLSITGGYGTTVSWFTSNCGGNFIGNGNPLTIPSPSVTTSYFARWETANCSNSTCQSITVTVNPLPASAGAIIGNTNVYQGQNSVTYSVSPIANATSYMWTLPTGAIGTSSTNSIIVDYGTSAISGIISVSGVNTCGYGTSSTLGIAVNQSPFINDESFSIAEFSTIGTSAGTVFASDPDNGQILTFTIISGNTDDAFTIDPSNGNITVNNPAALDFLINPAFNLVIRVSDDGIGNLYDDANITINVLQTPNQIPIINNQSFWVIENSPNGSLVDTIVAIDPDAGQILSYAIISGNTGNAFTIDPGSGILTVNNSIVLDFQTNPVFYLNVRVTDNGSVNLFDDALVTVDVLPTPNQAPAISNQAFMVNENAIDGTLVGTVLAFDPDAGQVLTYSILSGNTDNAFAINSTTGDLTVSNTAALNFEEFSSFTLNINAQDNGLGFLSSQATISVTLLDVNEPPLADDQMLSITEMPAYGTQVGIVTAVDPDTGQILIYTITSGNTDDAFAIDPATGTLSVNNSSALNYLVNPNFILNVRVSDDGAGNLFDDATISVIVLPNSNQSPSISNQIFRIDENSPENFFLGTIIATDPDMGQTLTYSIVSGNTNNAFAINSITGDLTVANQTALDYEVINLFHLIVQVKDNGIGNLSSEASVFVTLLDVNELPVVAQATFSIYESCPNGTLVGNVSASDPDAGQILTFEIVSGNIDDAFAINPINGSISVNNSSALNYLLNPIYYLIIRVNDNGEVSLSADAVIKINILQDPNQPPVISDQTFQVDENSTFGTQIGTVIALDPDAGQNLGYSIISGNDDNAFTLNATSGLLTVNDSSALDFELNRSYNLLVSVEDNGAGNLSSTANIRVELRDINEPPVFSDQTLNLIENSAIGTLVGKLIGSDPDAGQTLSWSITSGNTGNTFSINSITGNLYVANSALLIYATNPVFSLQVTTRDNGQGMLATTSYVTINLIQNTDYFVYIDPSQPNNSQENGSLLHPFNSWTDVIFTNGYSYFQKRGTTYVGTSNITIYGKNNITIDAYSTGNPPVIQNNAYYAKIIDLSSSKNCTIRNLEIKSAGNALCCIYLSGNSGSEINIENCNLHDATYGVRSIQKGNSLHIVSSMISKIILDGIYAANFKSIEIGNCNIFDVNQKWFQNPGTSVSTGDCIELNSVSGTVNIHHNLISHASTGNMTVVSISGGAYSGLIENNTITGNRLTGNECVRLNISTKTIVVRYNTISEGLSGVNTNMSSCLIYYNQFIGNNVAIKIQKNKPADIKNNTFFGNTSYSIESLSGAIVTSRNNIFYLDAQSTKVYKFGGSNVSDYNTFNVEKSGFLNGYNTLSLWSKATNQDKNSMIADPLFVNVSNKDLQLQSGSPCIDMGTNLNLFLDFFGTAVPQGGIPDIGFHEVESAAKNQLSLTTELPESKTEDISVSARVYPNPTAGTLYISLQNSGNSEADINILDMQGKIVANKSGNGDSLIMLNLENLNPGLYVAVININGKALTYKIIVQD